MKNINTSIEYENRFTETIIQENVPRGNVQRENVPRGNVQHRDAQQENVPRGNLHHKNVQQENVPRGNLHHKNVLHGNVPRGNVQHKNVLQEKAPGRGVSLIPALASTFIVVLAVFVFATFSAMKADVFAADDGQSGASAITDANANANTTTSTRAATAANDDAPRKYLEVDGVVMLNLDAMYSRIAEDNEEYKVSLKRTEIYKRRLAFAMSDKFIAENLPVPNPGNPTSRINWEKQRHTTWRTAELDLEKNENDQKNKYDSIKSSLKSQYISILDMQRSLKVYDDEMTKLETSILQTETRLKVGQAKQSDINTLQAQKQKLVADVSARRRDIDLAKLNLKSDLAIDFSKDIELEEYAASFKRYVDTGVEKKIAAAIEKDFSVYNTEQRLEILKEERAFTILYDKDGAFMTALQDNEVSIKQLEYDIINTKNTLESGFWASYYGILNQEDKIEIEEINVKLAEDALRVTSALLAQGMATQTDEQNDRISLENAKITLQTTINDYMRLVEDFEASLK